MSNFNRASALMSTFDQRQFQVAQPFQLLTCKFVNNNDPLACGKVCKLNNPELGCDMIASTMLVD